MLHIEADLVHSFLSTCFTRLRVAVAAATAPIPSLDRLASTADLEKGSCIAARSCTLCLGRIEHVTGNLAPSLVLSDSDVKALLYLLNHPIVVP